MPSKPATHWPSQGKLDLIEDLVKRAKVAGADAADAVVFESISNSASYRLGKLEDTERSESQDLGLRVFIGQQQAVVSSNDLTAKAIDPMVERAIAMAKLAPEDPYCGLAPADRLATTFPDLDLADPEEPSTEKLADMAAAAEAAGLAKDGITNSDGAGAGWGRGGIVLCTSEGFIGSYATTTFSVSCTMIAGEGTDMERDHDFATTRHGADLPSAESVGASAADRTLAKMNSRRMETQSVPIIYDPRVSMGLVGHLVGAISGPSVARGTSFLKDALGTSICPEGISIVDEPHRIRGLRSKPFDGEGVANQTWRLVDEGRLTTWIMGTSSAKQLGLETTGHAARGTGGPPGIGTTNLYMEPGTQSPAELMSDIKQGFYITSLIGQGVNGVTGDYSRGASGFWIEDGEITFPVNEMTIAGNLKPMFLNMTPANDLTFRYGTNAPTLRIEGMTVAGT